MKSRFRLVIFAASVFALLALFVVSAPRANNGEASASTPSCPNPFICPNPVIPLHQPLTALCGSGIGTGLTQAQIREGVTMCEDTTPRHVDIALFACGDNLANALAGLDCIASHYWNMGTTAQNAWSAAQVNTTLLNSVVATGTTMSVATPFPSTIMNGTQLTIDSGPNQETVTATACPGTCSNPFTVTPAFMHNHAAGVNVIGAFLQCTDIASPGPFDPYDDRVAWLTNTAFGSQPPTANPISIDDTITPVNSFVNHWNNSGSGDGGKGSNMANEAFEYGDNCLNGPGAGLPRLKWANNLVSPLFAIGIGSELQGTPYPKVTIDGTTLSALAYHWTPANTVIAMEPYCPLTQCKEPSDHVNEYPVIAWDRGFTVPKCLTSITGQPGAFLEIDPTLGADNAVLTIDPNLDSARLRATATFAHAATQGIGAWIDGTSPLDGRPFLFITNGGDCQDDSQPVFQSSYAWQSGNTLAVNSEDPFADTTTCNNFFHEPKRRAGPSQFALNSETVFASNHEVWQDEQSCNQPTEPGPAGGSSAQNNGGGGATCAPAVKPANCAGGLDDVSLRYWVLGNEMLFADYRYVWSRHNYIGPSGNDAAGLDSLGEDFIVAVNPVKAVSAYNEGSPDPSGNGCPGNGPHPMASDYGQDSGGILDVAVPGTCATSAPNAGSFFQISPVVSQQWRDCYVHGIYVGPCAVVGNFALNTSYADMTTGLTKTFGSELIPYAHILSLNDAGGTGPCAAASPGAVGGRYVSVCAQDVFEAGGQLQTPNPDVACLDGSAGPASSFNGLCLDITDYISETIVVSNAPNQGTMNQCTQGFDGSGHLSVCPLEYVILFK